MEKSNIHVVAAILEAEDGSVLVAQRPPGKSLAGAWEFPGGKLEAGEERSSALARELREELGIEVEAARPLIRYHHVYPDLTVDLDAWRVTRWRGDPSGQEGQALAWRDPGTLLESGLLPADLAIVNALLLPSIVLVTPPAAPNGEECFVDTLDRHAAPLRLVCLRRPDLKVEDLLGLATRAATRLKPHATRLILHGGPNEILPLLRDVDPVQGAYLLDMVAGLHVPARRLQECTERPVPISMWFGVSCHDASELAMARKLTADYAFLGNVLPTASHPGQPGMGWEKFEELVRDLPLPVYAIGGLGPEDLETAWAHGAQGIAAIRSLWPKD